MEAHGYTEVWWWQKVKTYECMTKSNDMNDEILVLPARAQI